MTHRGHVSVVFKCLSFRHAVIYQYMSSSDDPNLRLLVGEIDDLEDYTVVFYKGHWPWTYADYKCYINNAIGV